MRWLLSPAGNALHLARNAPDDLVPLARCHGFLVLSQRRTADHADLIAAHRHPRCKRCAQTEEA